MKALRRAIVGIVLLALVVAGVFFLLPETLGEDHPVSQAIDGTKVAATNAAIDATGIKSTAQQALEDNASVIASRTGLPLTVVENAIESLDIESWSVTTLPAGSQPLGTTDIDYNGIAATVTTYTDPSVVTVDMYGQAVTLAVPEGSRPYVRYLTLMG